MPLKSSDVTIEPDGTWVYPLRFEPRVRMDGKTDAIKLPFVVRIPARLWGSDIRQASAQAENNNDVLFCLVCSALGLTQEVVGRFDHRDYILISGRVQSLLEGEMEPASTSVHIVDPETPAESSTD